MPSAACSAAAAIASRGGLDVGQRRLDAARPDRGRAHVGQPDPRLGDPAALAADHRGHRHDRPRLGHPVELLVVHAPGAGQLGDADLDEQLPLLQRGRQVVDEELRRRHRPAPGEPGDDELRVEGQRHRRQVAGRVGVRERAAEGAAVPHLPVGHRLGRLGDQRGVLRDQRVGEDVGVRRHRADDDRVPVVADPAQLGDLRQVDDGLRGGEAQPHDRDQRLPPGHDLHVLATRGDRLQRLVDRGRPGVGEGCGNHRSPPSEEASVATPAVVSVCAPP